MRNFAVLGALVLAAAMMPQNVTAGTVYAVDGINDEIVTIDMTVGGEIGRFPTPEPSSGGPDGLAVTAASLFFVNGNGSNIIITLDPATGAVTGSFPAPEQFGGSDGLAAMDDTLFTLEPASDMISRVRISTGEALGSCTTGGLAGGGLAAESGRLFVTLGLASIVELDPETCQVVGGPFPIPGGDLAYGLAFDGERLYAGSIIRPGIHSLDPETGAALGFVEMESPPSGLASTAEVAVADPDCDLAVDFRPGSPTNILNIRSRGRVPVALFGSPDLDVGEMDQDSLALSGVRADHAAFEDVDGDGNLDLILHFRTQALVSSLEYAHGDLQDGMILDVVLTGERMEGGSCRGADSVRIRNSETGRDRESRNHRNKRGSR